LNRAALITAVFANGDYQKLRGLFDDRVHQPAREQLIPQLSKVIRAGEQAGAIGGWLSGSGSALMCAVCGDPTPVVHAMLQQLPQSEVRILSPDNRGASIGRSVGC
jgi:homoserine kinase